MSSFAWLPAAILGVLSWTFLEYVIHRFLGHDRRTFPNPFGAEHTRHHSEGDYFAPSWKKALVAVGVLSGAGVLVSLLLDLYVGTSYAASLALMYVAYEVFHRRAHTHAGTGALGRYLRRHHFHHHFENPASNYGVTSPFWDLVFGTKERPGRVRVPRKLAMRWLLDPDTGEVRREERAFYELRGGLTDPRPNSGPVGATGSSPV